MLARRETLYGLPIDLLTMEQTVERILNTIENGGTCRHAVLNAPKVVRAQSDETLASAIRGCDLVSADGSWVAFAARLSGVQVPERFGGVDLMQRLLSVAAERGMSVFLLGASEPVVEEVAVQLVKQHPNLKVAGYHHGYYDRQDNLSVVNQIKTSQAQLLFVALPTPRKELWLAENFQRTGSVFAMGVGGSFDVVAGIAARAPRWAQHIGCEWLWRLAQEPRRLARRYFQVALPFLRLALCEAIRRRQLRSSG